MNSKKVSELLGVSTDTLRYYERIGVIPRLNAITTVIVSTKPMSPLHGLYCICQLRNGGIEIMNSKKVSELLGVSTDTLRYYERIGVIPRLNAITTVIVSTKPMT